MKRNTHEQVTLKTWNLKKLLKENLHIPDYQRIYCWEEKQVYHLLDDIFSITKDYHLGNIILQCKDNHYDIIDGQQRLVTLTLLLEELKLNCTLSLLKQCFEDDTATKYVAYNKYLIQTYLSKHNLQDKDKLLNNIVFSVLILGDTSLDLAYTFFSNQNGRGKKLTDYDLLKAHHLRLIDSPEQAYALAKQWDTEILNTTTQKLSHDNSEESDKDIAKTLGTYLFRLRKWRRKRAWNNSEERIVKKEFESSATIPELSPFGEGLSFNESIRGGSHFFVYSYHFVNQYRAFQKTLSFESLALLQRETHGYYREIIEAFLFGYFIKFGDVNLEDALICIMRLISNHRYKTKRIHYQGLLDYASASEIILMIETAPSPTYFLAEILQCIKEKELQKPDDFNATGIRLRYYNIECRIQNQIQNHLHKTIKDAIYYDNE